MMTKKMTMMMFVDVSDDSNGDIITKGHRKMRIAMKHSYI